MLYIIVQPALYRFVILACVPHCLIISCLPLSPAHRVMQYCLCLCHHLRETPCRRMFCFCLLGFLAQFRLIAHRPILIIPRYPPRAVPAIHISPQLIQQYSPTSLSLVLISHFLSYFIIFTSNEHHLLYIC